MNNIAKDLFMQANDVYAAKNILIKHLRSAKDTSPSMISDEAYEEIYEAMFEFAKYLGLKDKIELTKKD